MNASRGNIFTPYLLQNQSSFPNGCRYYTKSATDLELYSPSFGRGCEVEYSYFYLYNSQMVGC